MSPSTRIHFFGGKGGVGKTTCAAAFALARAQSAAAGRVLLISTDPAHSLGDALGVSLSARVGPVRGAAKLDAVELDAPRAFARWVARHGSALGDAIEHGTWLDRGDVNALLGLPIPGVDELAGMLEIVRLSEKPYDAIVVDTAPTGHTLRLLAAPETVAALAAVLDQLQRDDRLIRARFGHLVRPDAADRLIDMLAAQARQTGEWLRDGARTAFHWVMLPEALSLAESEDGVRALEQARIPVVEVVINRVMADGAACRLCDRRRAEERGIITLASTRVGANRTITIVPALPIEPRGVAALKRLAARRRAVPAVQRARRPTAAPAVMSAAPAEERSASVWTRVTGAARLLFIGGKGGVGKTTVAAATALQLARRDEARRVLLLSTDPAHSLGDVFDAAVDDRAAPARGGPPNLYLRELDPQAALQARRTALEAALNEIVATVGGKVGGRGVSELMDLAPPGIDELFGLVSVSELLASEYDVVVVDTAPTGHTLRLLELPDAAREWLQVLLRVLLKYRELVRPGQLAAELLDLSRQVRALQELLRSPDVARFVVVTRAAELPRAETERLLTRLRKLRIASPVVVVNALTLAPAGCRRCRATAAGERRQLAPLARACRRRSRDCVIIQAPLVAPPPRGVDALERWARAWIG